MQIAKPTPVAPDLLTERRQPIQAESEPAFDYDEAVAEAKQIIAEKDSSREWLRLGELADKLEPRYGEQTLKRFAKDIGIAACTLERHRSVFRAWPKEAPAPKSYAVAQELRTPLTLGRSIPTRCLF
jgi:hypothetical protein